MEAETQRSQVVDLAKGISIALVAFGHSALPHHLGAFNGAFGLFRMPLFFFVSGALLSTQTDGLRFLLRRTDALLKPYLVVSLLLMLQAWWVADPVWVQQALGTLWATSATVRWVPLWFLPHLWLVTVAVHALATRTQGWLSRSPVNAALAVAGMLAAGLAVLALAAAPLPEVFNLFRSARGEAGQSRLGWPFSADLLLLTGSYALAGFCWRLPLRRFEPRSAVVALALLVWLAVALGTDAAINFGERVYHQPVLALAASVAGIYLVLAICWHFQHRPVAARLLTRLGQAGLVILVLHAPISAKTLAVLEHTWPTLNPLGLAWLAWAVSLIVPVAVHTLVKRIPLLSCIFLPVARPVVTPSAAPVVAVLSFTADGAR